jgi:hypothetical protein
MPLSGEISKNFDHAFICAESYIEGICNILRKRIAPTIEISATLNDGTTRRFVDEVELFKFNNPRSRRIQQLSLTSRDRGENYSRISLEFNKESLGRRIAISGEASDETIVVVRQELGEIVESTKPSYSPIAVRYSGLGITLGFISTGLVILCLLLAFWDTPKESQKLSISISHITELVIGGTLLLIAPIFIGSAFERLIKWAFPVGIFVIGDEKMDSNRLEKRRNILGVGVLLAFAVSIAANYFSRSL